MTRAVRSITMSAVRGSSAARCSSSSNNLAPASVAMSKASAWRWPPDRAATRIAKPRFEPEPDRRQRGNKPGARSLRHGAS